MTNRLDRKTRTENRRLYDLGVEVPTDLTRDEIDDIIGTARDISDQVLWTFSEMHPAVVMTYEQWENLKEMIRREVECEFGQRGGGASDLLLDKK